MRVRRLRAPVAPTTCPTWSTSSPASGSCTSTPGPPTSPRRTSPEVVDEFTDGGRAPTCGAAAGPTPSTPTTGCRAWPATASSTSSTLPLVSTFHTLARVKAETGDPEPDRRVEAETEVIGCSDAILANCAAEADQLVELYGADPRASRSCRPASTTPSSRPATGGAPAPRSASATTRCCCSSAASSRSRASTSPSRPWPSSRRHPDAVLVVVGGPSGPDGRRRAGARRTRWSPRLGLARPGALRRARSPTTCCRPTTGPPTCASCRAGRSRSGWWRSRRRPAARRWWPPRSAGCAPSSTTASPASSSTAATRPTTPPPSPRILDDPALAARDGRGRGRSWPGATRGRPPRPGCAGSTPTSPLGPGRSCRLPRHAPPMPLRRTRWPTRSPTTPRSTPSRR